MPTRKGNEHLFSAVVTFYPGKAFLEIAAFKKLVDGSTYHRPPETVLLLELFRVNTLKLFKMAGHHLEERRGFRIAPPVDLPGLGYFADHGLLPGVSGQGSKPGGKTDGIIRHILVHINTQLNHIDAEKITNDVRQLMSHLRKR